LKAAQLDGLHVQLSKGLFHEPVVFDLGLEPDKLEGRLGHLENGKVERLGHFLDPLHYFPVRNFGPGLLELG